MQNQDSKPFSSTVALPRSETAAKLDGLTSAEAAARLAREGPNELPHAGGRRLGRILRDVLSEPMFALLLGSGFIYLLLGDKLEALLLTVFASLSVVIAVVQETRSERVIEALRDLTSPRALVIRDCERRRIAGREVVRGDLVVLSEGDRVPADGVLLEAKELLTDESLLTGESVAVRKISARELTAMQPRPGGDDLPFVWSGTLVVRGQGIAEATATGAGSEIGRIGKSLASIESASPRLSRQTAQIVKVAAGLGVLCCAAVVLLYGLLRGGWLNALLAGIALSMSLLPEEFPVVLAVFMVMGAWRISRARVLTRRAAAIETLGEATVLCADKTGTLTENRMSIAMLDTMSQALNLSGGTEPDFPARHLVMVGAMASSPDAYDPMDRAFQELNLRWGGDLSNCSLVRHYALRTDLLAVTYVWRTANGRPLRVASKGAPEALAELCHLSEQTRALFRSKVNALAEAGMRVLAIAEATTTDALPDNPREFNFQLLGLVGIADPVRDSVPPAIAECRAAGIRVVMITGDYPLTARAVAQQAGIQNVQVLDGPSLEAFSDVELRAAVQRTNVFARIIPAQKLRIVQALQSAGDVVAMTGDGVNDAPALKAADIGIAMGGRGTDVAREAASLVLLDDDFGSIVRTIRLGRRIYDNLRKAMAYIVAVHVPIATLAVLPLLTGLPLIFAPVHIAFMEMVIDPVCSLVFEAELAEPDLMSRPPRAATSQLFSRPILIWALLQGFAAAISLALTYWLALRRGLPETDARTLTFVSLVLVNLGLVLVNRSFGAQVLHGLDKANHALWWVSGTTLALLVMVLAWHPARALFQFGPLHWDDLVVVIAIPASVVLLLQLLKHNWRTRLAA
jgi:P-type Ca2+ transporter type 2C